MQDESLPSPSVLQGSDGVPVTGAAEGFCPFDCNAVFNAMLGVLTLISVLLSTGRIGNQLVSLRAVEPRDKAASLVIMVSALSVFVFLPSPIFFGAIIDGACKVWGDNCGERTNCQLYDTDRLRETLHYTVGVCILLATLCDFGVWWNSKEVSIFGEEEEKEEEKDDKPMEEVKRGISEPN